MGSSVSAHTRRVDLSGKGLKDLGEIKHLDKASVIESLERIDLSKNKLTRVAHIARLSVSSLHHVAELSLRKNRLTDFPQAITALVSLRVLDMSHNEIPSIPDDILDFYRLEELILNDNRIARLPWRMDKLRQCRIVHLQNNLIRFFPSFLVKMRSLEVLEISNNPFDMATYGEPRSAEELLQALCKQPVPEMYQEEAAQMDVALKDTPRDLLHTIMRYKEGVASIEDFCRKELNVENALFYVRVRKFRQYYKSKREIKHSDLIDEALAIHEEFIKVKSPHQLNFSFDVMNKLRTRLDHERELINQWVFDEVFEIVSTYMVDEILPRFRLLPENASLIALVQKKLEKKGREKAQLCGKQLSALSSLSNSATSPAQSKKKVSRTKSGDDGPQSQMNQSNPSADSLRASHNQSHKGSQ